MALLFFGQLWEILLAAPFGKNFYCDFSRHIVTYALPRQRPTVEIQKHHLNRLIRIGICKNQR